MVELAAFMNALGGNLGVVRLGEGVGVYATNQTDQEELEKWLKAFAPKTNCRMVEAASLLI